MKSPLLYDKFASPARARRGLRWVWTITDGIGGRPLATGRTLTEWGADRVLTRVLRRCEPRPHIVDIAHPPLHPLSGAEAADVSTLLATEGVRVDVRPAGGTVWLCPAGDLSTWQMAAALCAVVRRTDAPVRWRAVRHG